MGPETKGSEAAAFGRFLLLPRRRELLADGQAIDLGARAFDILMALIEARGTVLGKDALAAKVWPGQTVQDSALQVQISALRAALGADRDLIRTISGRGYQFAGEIREAGEIGPRQGAGVVPPPPPAQASRPATNLAVTVSELIERDQELAEIESLTASHRLVTLVGAGGIGKTHLAIAVAHRVMPRFDDGVWIVELSPVSDGSLLPAVVATAVGLGPGSATKQHVARLLAGKRLLLVLDTCEHLIGAAAAFAEELLQAGPAAHVIATSREPLRAEGEWIYRVPPLAVPEEDAGADPLHYGAVRLFIERARARGPHFAPDPRDIATIAAICRRLDGLPLAIELAAARTAAFSLGQLLELLQDRFRLLSGGRRTSLPRHQTLRAALDWSYQLLPEPEREIARRLAIFKGVFSLEAVSAVAASTGVAPVPVIDGLAELVMKSLVVTEPDHITYYRLLDTTREYLLEKLAESGERDELARRHAEYYRDVFERSDAEWETRPTAEWLTEYRRKVDNLRAALDWAFAPGGDPSIGVALTAAAADLWMRLSLLTEVRQRVEQALAAVTSGAECAPRHDMKLHAALASSLMSTKPGIPEIETLSLKALRLAESLDSSEYRLRALYGLWFFNTNKGRHRAALTYAERLRAVAAARPDTNDELIGDRSLGTTFHILGDQATARSHMENVLVRYRRSNLRTHSGRFGFDLLVIATNYLARILWLMGLPEQAMRMAERAIEEARAVDHANSLGLALAMGACPIARLSGYWEAAESYAEMLLDHTSRHGLAYWHTLGRTNRGLLMILRGDAVRGIEILHASLQDAEDARWQERLMAFTNPRAEALAHGGKTEAALAAVAETIAELEQTEELWLLPEMLRMRGELLLAQNGQDACAAAETCFRRALDLAGRQHALSWELRAATSLARLLRGQGHSGDATAMLRSTYGRFTEGFDTADLQSADTLLKELG